MTRRTLITLGVILILILALSIWQSSAPSAHSGWKTCENKALGFSLQYPGDWQITTPAGGTSGPDNEPNPNPVLASCDPAPGEIPVHWGTLMFEPEWSDKSGTKFRIEVCDIECMNSSIYKGVTTLDQYLARNPSINPSEDAVASRGTLAGEPSATLLYGETIVFHTGMRYTLYGRPDVLATFTFLK